MSKIISQLNEEDIIKKNNQKIYVVDTNIILEDLNNIKNLSEEGKNIIVVPETVILELESKKKDLTEIGFQARNFARMISDSIEEKSFYKNDKKNPENNFSIVKLLCRFPLENNNKKNIKIHIISKDNYKVNKVLFDKEEINDKRIIEIAELAKKYYIGNKIIFLSLDIYARLFSKLKNISTETLNKNKNEENKNQLELLKTIFLEDKNEFDNLDNKDIIDIDKEYKKENFSYEFKLKSNDTFIKYAIISNEKIRLIKEEDFEKMPVKPKNIEQKLYTKALLDPFFDLYVIDALAGSGKTLMSLTGAMKLIDNNKSNCVFNKIIYVRNSIESIDKGADIGYLAGNEEKLRIYNMSLYDNLNYIAQNNVLRKIKKNKEKIEEKENLNLLIENEIEFLIQKYNITKIWVGELRGRTLTNAIVIFDEWQNSSNKTTQLALSRLDETCKGIFIGSNKQIDNMYLNKYDNGLTSMLNLSTKIFKKEENLNFFGIKMEKSVRGKFAIFADNVL